MIRFIDLMALAAGAERAPETYDVAFVAAALDDRGPRSRALVEASAARSIEVAYKPAETMLQLDADDLRPYDLDGIMAVAPARRILLDATSLDVVEMILICRAYLRTPGVEVGFVYAEPGAYIPSNVASGAVQQFAFSDRCHGAHAVPGFAHELRDDAQGWMVVCVGYESDRLERIFDDDDGAFINHATLVFGIPPYRTSWELHSLLPHLSLLGAQGRREIAFAGANNPRATFLELKKASEAVAGTVRAQLLVAPLGSKPSSIGVALFACLRDDLRLKYDFPIRTAGGTVGVGPIYRYLVAKGD